jgi:uncharacterized protein YgbK (DUF1537 family)
MTAPRLVFYGDDFTGSTDALEVLAFAGLKVVLFVAPPGAAMLARYPGLDAIGVAGDSRGMSGAEMEAGMPAVLAALHATGAPIVHYKVCSTFDSSPETGSIGRILTLARGVFRNPWIPIVGGTPALARYCLFGNLFARSGTDGRIYRIDRHPVMSVHPVTPMKEGDLARHIEAQAPEGANLTIASLGYPSLEAGPDAARVALDALAADRPDAILVDGGSAAHQTVVGALLDRAAEDSRPLFVIGGSGVEYALMQHWGLAGVPGAFERFAPVDRLLAISGSASKVSAAQIDAAVAVGFAEIAVDPVRLLAEPAFADTLVAEAARALEEGRSVLLHTVRGPDDPRIAALRAAHGDAYGEAGRRLGEAMGCILGAVQARTGLTRLAVAGGDTSSQAVQVLGIDALEVAARLTPGVPLCRILAAGRPLDGVEIALKGGQMGAEDFFEAVRRGRP